MPLCIFHNLNSLLLKKKVAVILVFVVWDQTAWKGDTLFSLQKVEHLNNYFTSGVHGHKHERLVYGPCV